MNNIQAIMRSGRIGQAPKLILNPVNILAAAGAALIGYDLGGLINGSLMTRIYFTLFCMCALWVIHRYFERGGDNNGGWLFLTDPPESIDVQQEPSSSRQISGSLSDIYSDVFGEEIEVEAQLGSRFDVHIIDHERANLSSASDQMLLARKLGIEVDDDKSAQFNVIPSWGDGRSALVISKALGAGEKPPIVPFEFNERPKGRLTSFLGRDIRGRAIGNDRSVASHLMISGTTGAGKTVTFRNEVVSQRLAAPNAIIYSIDYKGGLSGCPNDKFTEDMSEGLRMIREFIGMARENWQTVKEAGFDNWFEYDEAYPGELAPLFINIDEMPQFRSVGDSIILRGWEEAKNEARQNGDDAPIKPLLTMDLLGEILRVYRAGGAFASIGIQDPNAKILPRDLRSLFDSKVAMRVDGAIASRVAIGCNGAERLPPMGGMIFKMASNSVQIGSSAFITNVIRDNLLKEWRNSPAN